jgi:uncharacterized protein YecE (DUF72 family)
MEETRVRIGCSGYPVERRQYQALLGFVELQDTRRVLPKPDKFSRIKMSAPPGFEFAMVAPEALSDPEQAEGLPGDPRGYGALRPTPENIDLLQRTLLGAQRLDAVVRLHTTSDLGAGPDAFERFRGLLAGVDRRGVRLAWESRGPLTAKEVIRWSEQLDLIPVVDPFQDDPPPGPIGYIHLHPLITMTGSLNAEHYLRLLERAARHAECYLVFDTPHAFRDAVALRRLLRGEAGVPGDEPAPDGAEESEPEDAAEAGPDEAEDSEADESEEPASDP